MNEKIKSFTDLKTWQEGHNLVLITYKTLENLPKKENFALTPQIQRSAISITSNITEGFSRRTNKEKLQFYHIALGSLSELQSQITIVKDLNYIEKEEFAKIMDQTFKVQKLLNGLIKSGRILNT